MSLGGLAVLVEIAVLLLGVMAGLGAGLLLWARRPEAPAPKPADPWDVVVARRCVVNLKTGRAVDGVLVRRDHGLLFLKNAVVLEQGQEPAPVDGEALVQLVHVDFIQAL
ncbi:RNA binding protein [Arthrobacter phage Andrew]|uniref:RNA binding protein n=1 Tax=Arthrobacter phage Andrew TaxID=2419946 RepID=A0A3G2KD15_9CAUD|nr:RNA binding protein [Arthrobacter phage Andrew]AYN56821.1 RNA binding protein [Arthrobacter phage Andrew]